MWQKACRRMQAVVMSSQPGHREMAAQKQVSRRLPAREAVVHRQRAEVTAQRAQGHGLSSVNEAQDRIRGRPYD